MSGGDNNNNNNNAVIVEQILNAKTLYKVLGVDQHNLEPSALRKAYLTTSVKVHPDKCPHPQATQAFQRVAEAWSTLSDDTARAAYDAELRYSNRSNSYSNDYYHSGQHQSHNNNNHKTYYASDFERTHMPSFQEALFMFATATSMFAGSGGSTTSRAGSAVNVASDFMETLFWAQKLAEGRQQQRGTNDHDCNDFDHDNKTGHNSSQSAAEAAANNPLSSGMALGSGLRALAGAQRMMGMTKSATATEKAATAVQVAAVGATVLQAAHENPAVKRTLERGQEAWKNNPQIGRGLRASLKLAGSLVKSLQEAQTQQQQQQQQQQQSSGAGAGSAGSYNANKNRAA